MCRSREFRVPTEAALECVEEQLEGVWAAGTGEVVVDERSQESIEVDLRGDDEQPSRDE
jgi:hypothetical protein